MAKRREISWGASVKTKSAFSSDNALFYFHFYGSGMVVFWPTLSVCDITGQNIRHIVPILYNTEQKTIEKEVNQIRLVLTTLTSGLIHMLMWLQKSLTHKQMQVGSICWMKLHKTNLPGFFFFAFTQLFESLWMNHAMTGCELTVRAVSVLVLFLTQRDFSSAAQHGTLMLDSPPRSFHPAWNALFFFSTVQVNIFWTGFVCNAEWPVCLFTC